MKRYNKTASIVVICFGVVLTIATIIAALCVKPVSVYDFDPYEVTDNTLGIENSGDLSGTGEAIAAEAVIVE